MRIAVVDDERYAREELSFQIREVLPEAEIVLIDTGAKAIEQLTAEHFDIAFLDIRLGDIKGTTIADILRRYSPDMQIIFSTAYGEYGVEAFELGVNNYILKPYDPARVRKVLEQSCRELQKAEAERKAAEGVNERIAVNGNRRTTMLNVKDIVYIDCGKGGHQCVLHLKDRTEVLTSATLSEMENNLLNRGFYRAHKTVLVQMACVTEVTLWGINNYAMHVRNYQELLPVSRDKVKEIRDLLKREFSE